ncbi:methyltransferase domain-containing protein [Streptomyces sp. NPDC057116]|uniref:methyltransferase domain-containing protein n=1 Tax=Streptomyces sp. NPDC057116 TaxID=3346023 RepID=UPI00364571A4
MSVTRRYRDAWEAFWEEAPPEEGAVIWDAAPSLTAGRHLELFAPHLTAPGLPLVDLGCGNGTQTLFLAGRYARVVGVDVAAAAIGHARRRDGRAAAARFRVLDAADRAAVRELHAELGDANVYMRGVLHQAEPRDRQALADAIATLVGERGRAFVVELAEAAGTALRGLADSPAGPPPKLEPVLRHGIAPAGVVDADIPEYFRTAGLGVLASGAMPLATTEHAPDGTRVDLPSLWLVAGRDA